MSRVGFGVFRPLLMERSVESRKMVSSIGLSQTFPAMIVFDPEQRILALVREHGLCPDIIVVLLSISQLLSAHASLEELRPPEGWKGIRSQSVSSAQRCLDVLFSMTSIDFDAPHPTTTGSNEYPIDTIDSDECFIHQEILAF